MNQKKLKELLAPDNIIDVMLLIDKGKIIKFSLNYRAKINGKWNEIYRVDNFHGFLHEQKFWKSPKPIRLEENIPINLIFEKHFKNIKDNYKKYRSYMEEKWRKIIF